MTAKETKEEWLENIKKVKNLINTKVSSESSLVYELDVMEAGINSLPNGTGDNQDDFMDIASQLVGGVVAAIQGSYTELIQLGIELMKKAITFAVNKYNESWFLKTMAIDYAIDMEKATEVYTADKKGKNVINFDEMNKSNRTALDEIIRVLRSEEKPKEKKLFSGDWHVVFAVINTVGRFIQNKDILVDNYDEAVRLL